MTLFKGEQSCSVGVRHGLMKTRGKSDIENRSIKIHIMHFVSWRMGANEHCKCSDLRSGPVRSFRVKVPG
jgi:hypothetical protein